MRSLPAAVPTLLLAIGLAGPNLRAASPPLIPSPKPAAALTAYAERHGIPIQGVDPATSTDPSHPGDEAVYLLALQLPAGEKQWLVRLRAAAPDDRKGETKPLARDTIFTSTGLELQYSHHPAALELEFVGPFVPAAAGNDRVATSRSRTVVSAESLESGLYRYCESSLHITERLKAAGIAQPIYYGIGRRPDASAIEQGRKAAEAFQLTADEERLAFSVYFALRAFYEAASKIPACREALEPVVQKPSLWSIATDLGVNTNFEYGWQHVIRVPDGAMPVTTPVYALPARLSLNGRPALDISLAATSTQPPLRQCAGIVSLAAAHPTDANKRIFLHLLSARKARLPLPPASP